MSLRYKPARQKDKLVHRAEQTQGNSYTTTHIESNDSRSIPASQTSTQPVSVSSQSSQPLLPRIPDGSRPEAGSISATNNNLRTPQVAISDAPSRSLRIRNALNAQGHMFRRKRADKKKQAATSTESVSQSATAVVVVPRSPTAPKLESIPDLDDAAL
jgi:hypothetical protein